MWSLYHYDDDTRTPTSTTQISEINFQNGAADFGYTIRRYNAGWSNVEDPYNKPDSWNQRFSSSRSILSLTSNYWNILYEFTYDPENPNILIGQSIGASNKGFAMSLVKK